MTFEIAFLLSFIFLIGLCWGSFLNVVAYRLTFDKPFFTMRSQCPHCDKVIAWYDNIPVFSWIFLGGKCRACRKPISIVYPLFELLTATVMLLLAVKFLPRFFPMYYLLTGDPFSLDVLALVDGLPIKTIVHVFSSLAVYVFFLSALLASTIADLRAMAIPQLFTLWLAPFGIIFSYFGLTSVSWQVSVLGALLGYGILLLVATLFKVFTKKDGLGVGDMELLCMIGAFLGPLGMWFSLMVGSITGMMLGGLYLWLSGRGRMTRIPFGPFLALGAMVYFFCGQQIVTLLSV